MKILLALFITSLCSCAIEKPEYELLAKEGAFELRKYPEIKIVSAPMEDMEGRDQSFRKLFRYISGDNAGKQKIAMTSPVFMDMGEDVTSKKSAGRMSFMVPAKVTEKGAPAPDEESLEISEIGEGTFAVIRFKGWNKAPQRDAASIALEKVVQDRKLKPIGNFFFAFYDPPWTPEMFRTNEVWQRVEPTEN